MCRINSMHAWAMLLLCLAGIFHIQVLGQESESSSEYSSASEEYGDLNFAGKAYTLSEAHEYKRVTVYFMYSDERDDRKFITLEEGLATGKVKVREHKSAAVNELLIRNRSGRPLFLQEGDRVVGGKQDRIVPTTIVMESGPEYVPLRVYCVESGRWTAGARGTKFGKGKNKVMAMTQTRISAKYARDQGKVWGSVSDYKSKAELKLGTQNSNSSLTQTMDSHEVKKMVTDIQRTFNKKIAERQDIVGAVFLVDGELAEMNIYAGYPLFVKMFPKLMSSVVADSKLQELPDVNVGETKQTSAWMTELKESVPGSKSFKHVVHEKNETKLYFHENGSASAYSRWNKKPIHTQVMAKVNMGDVKDTNPSSDEEQGRVYQQVMERGLNELPVSLEELGGMTADELAEKYVEKVEEKVKKLEELKNKDLDEIREGIIKNHGNTSGLIPKLPGQ